MYFRIPSDWQALKNSSMKRTLRARLLDALEKVDVSSCGYLVVHGEIDLDEDMLEAVADSQYTTKKQASLVRSVHDEDEHLWVFRCVSIS